MAKKIFDWHCPNCGNEELEYDILEPQGETITQDVICNGCNFSFYIYTESIWYYEEEDTDENIST